MTDKLPPIMFEDARLLFRNFTGREGPYNREGDRGFSVEIPDEAVAKKMMEDGWNVKWPKAREDEEEESYSPHLPVAVKFDILPPRIVLITSKARTTMTKEMVGELDSIEIETVDLMVNASNWTVNGKTGVKAYLKSMYVTMAEDELDRKYAVSNGEEQ